MTKIDLTIENIRLRAAVESLTQERDSLMEMLEDYDLVELWKLKYPNLQKDNPCSTSS